MTTTVRETERKYEVTDGVELPQWAGLAGVQSLVGPEEQTLEAVYYDTEDLRLARAGVTLRRRHGGDDAGRSRHRRERLGFRLDTAADRRPLQLPDRDGAGAR